MYPWVWNISPDSSVMFIQNPAYNAELAVLGYYIKPWKLSQFFCWGKKNVEKERKKKKEKIDYKKKKNVLLLLSKQYDSKA